MAAKQSIKPRDLPLLVVVGPTASGKSELAMRLAERYGGEIICADSRTVYKGMDIGTAKPSRADQAAIRHHLLDIVRPDQNFTAADFKREAEETIADIRRRKRLPIMAGGSGLYIDAVLYDFKFAKPDAPKDTLNPRHLRHDVAHPPKKLRSDAILIGLTRPRNELKSRIEARVDIMLKDGLLDEVSMLQAKYPHSRALLATGYKAFVSYEKGEVSLEEARRLFIRNDCQLAKRQMTWFKRSTGIQWFGSLEEAEHFAETVLVD